jgi:alpha-1,3-glucan synthase
MMIIRHLCPTWLLLSSAALALRYDPEQVKFNLNTNRTAIHPLDYAGKWENHVFHPSPPNWRMPAYTVMLDRFVNGNPSNDNANGTQYEHDITQTQLRHGGDIRGLEDSLDYLQGMGIKVSDLKRRSIYPC